MIKEKSSPSFLENYRNYINITCNKTITDQKGFKLLHITNCNTQLKQTITPNFFYKFPKRFTKSIEKKPHLYSVHHLKSQSLHKLQKSVIVDSILESSHDLNAFLSYDNQPFIPYLYERDKLGRIIQQRSQSSTPENSANYPNLPITDLIPSDRESHMLSRRNTFIFKDIGKDDETNQGSPKILKKKNHSINCLFSEVFAKNDTINSSDISLKYRQYTSNNILSKHINNSQNTTEFVQHQPIIKAKTQLNQLLGSFSKQSGKQNNLFGQKKYLPKLLGISQSNSLASLDVNPFTSTSHRSVFGKSLNISKISEKNLQYHAQNIDKVIKFPTRDSMNESQKITKSDLQKQKQQRY